MSFLHRRILSTAVLLHIINRKRAWKDEKMKKQNFRREWKFTLVELLVTIAVIAILASLLLPVLNKARMKANEISCISNKKQFMSAQQIYADDYNGYMIVQTRCRNHGGSWCVFSRHLCGEIDKRKLYISWSVMTCPANPALPRRWIPGQDWQVQNGVFGMFVAVSGENSPITNTKFISSMGKFMISGMEQTDDSSDNMTHYSLAQAKRSSETIVLLDTMFRDPSLANQPVNASHYKFLRRGHANSSKGVGIHLIHGNRTAAGFLDGHASSLSGPQLGSNPTNIVRYYDEFRIDRSNSNVY